MHSLPLPHSSGNNREHTAGSSVGNFCPRRSLVSAHQMCPSIFEMKIFGCGCSKECIQMAWWQKNWQDREQWQNLFSRKSENLYKEKFHTPSKNLAEHPIEVHSSVFCWGHQNRMTTGGQWTQKSKGSFFVTRQFSKTKVVSFFMQHTGMSACPQPRSPVFTATPAGRLLSLHLLWIRRRRLRRSTHRVHCLAFVGEHTTTFLEAQDVLWKTWNRRKS